MQMTRSAILDSNLFESIISISSVAQWSQNSYFDKKKHFLQIIIQLVSVVRGQQLIIFVG